ncbi:MAG: SRPBCC family protein [Gammaproteobacteria bacterium]|jgi:carbon monoxide dehydrogenase subunit G
MNLQGERHIPASVEATWAALNDPEVLKQCIAGCESLERTGDNQFQSTMAVRIGPVNARFKGKLELQNIVPMDSYTIAFEGQGGVAGFGKGTADVKLSPDGTGTLLAYSAKAQVGGKLAQVGSRLIDSAAAKIAEDFFSAFTERLAPPEAEAPAAEAAVPAAAPPGVVVKPWLPWAIAALLIIIVLVYLLD